MHIQLLKNTNDKQMTLMGKVEKKGPCTENKDAWRKVIHPRKAYLHHAKAASMKFAFTNIVTSSPFPHAEIWSAICSFDIENKILDKANLVMCVDHLSKIYSKSWQHK